MDNQSKSEKPTPAFVPPENLNISKKPQIIPKGVAFIPPNLSEKPSEIADYVVPPLSGEENPDTEIGAEISNKETKAETPSEETETELLEEQAETESPTKETEKILQIKTNYLKRFFGHFATKLTTGVAIGSVLVGVAFGVSNKESKNPNPNNQTTAEESAPGYLDPNGQGTTVSGEQTIGDKIEYTEDINKYIKQTEHGYIIEGNIHLKSLDKSLLNPIGEDEKGWMVYEHKGKKYVDRKYTYGDPDYVKYDTVHPYGGKVIRDGFTDPIWANDGSNIATSFGPSPFRNEIYYSRDDQECLEAIKKAHPNSSAGIITTSGGFKGFFISDAAGTIVALSYGDEFESCAIIYYDPPEPSFADNDRKLDHIDLEEVFKIAQFMTMEKRKKPKQTNTSESTSGFVPPTDEEKKEILNKYGITDTEYNEYIEWYKESGELGMSLLTLEEFIRDFEAQKQHPAG